MPPLPDPLYDETKTKLERLARRLNDVEVFQVPRLRDHAGSVALQQQYAAEVREDLESCRRELQILETFVDDIRNAERRKEMNDELDILIPKVEDLKKAFRAALLESKRKIDSQTSSYREEMLRSGSGMQASSSRTRGSNSYVVVLVPLTTISHYVFFREDAVMHASEAVTDALRQTTQLMQQELERSILSTQLLEESTKTMQSTSDLYTTFGTLLTTSKTLIASLQQADWLDRMIIFSSLAIFLLAVAYIVKKRVIDRGLWLAFWWVKYLPMPKRSAAQVAVNVGKATLSSVSSSTPPPASIATESVTAATEFATTLSSLIATASTLSSAIPSITSSAQSAIEDELSSAPTPSTSVSPEPSDSSVSLASSIIDDLMAQVTATPVPQNEAMPTDGDLDAEPIPTMTEPAPTTHSHVHVHEDL
ncbi:Sec20-domain-containing protein [Clavulina sp. PMI_390]|nr:Sec20-domain-containing protein [Clavulina sp. PMI_390]